MSQFPPGITPDGGEEDRPLPPRQPPKSPPRDRPVAPPAYYPAPPTRHPDTTRLILLGGLAGVLLTLFAEALLAGVLYLAVWERVGPGPGPAPIPAPSGPLRVIMVSDSSANMSKGQLDALGSTAVRGWLNSHCGKDSAGLPAWRSWDKDTDPKEEPDDWQKAWKALQPNLKSLPAVVIYEGGKGKVFALPDSEDGLMKLLSRYGGK